MCLSTQNASYVTYVLMHCRASLAQLPEDVLFAIAEQLEHPDRVRPLGFWETNPKIMHCMNCLIMLHALAGKPRTGM